jgi:ABC-type multidrug transport system fused ATPase/permease subunit
MFQCDFTNGLWSSGHGDLLNENILFSRPDATEEQFLFVCRTARVDEFAEQYREAYDTIVGKRGVKLSGG